MFFPANNRKRSFYDYMTMYHDVVNKFNINNNNNSKTTITTDTSTINTTTDNVTATNNVTNNVTSVNDDNISFSNVTSTGNNDEHSVHTKLAMRYTGKAGCYKIMEMLFENEKTISVTNFDCNYKKSYGFTDNDLYIEKETEFAKVGDFWVSTDKNGNIIYKSKYPPGAAETGFLKPSATYFLSGIICRHIPLNTSDKKPYLNLIPTDLISNFLKNGYHTANIRNFKTYIVLYTSDKNDAITNILQNNKNKFLSLHDNIDALQNLGTTITISFDLNNNHDKKDSFDYKYDYSYFFCLEQEYAALLKEHMLQLKDLPQTKKQMETYIELLKKWAIDLDTATNIKGYFSCNSSTCNGETKIMEYAKKNSYTHMIVVTDINTQG